MRRVVVTGAGTVNPLGLDVSQTMHEMAQGRTAIGPLDIEDVDRLQVRIGAQVSGFDPAALFDARALAMLDRFCQFALVAGRQAAEQAGLADVQTPPHRRGVIMGTAAGGLMTWEESYRAVFQGGRDRVHPFTVPRLMTNAAASQLAMAHGCTGPCLTTSTACASSNHAIGQAFQTIRASQADIMLAGGAEAMVTFGGIKAWEGLRVLSPDGCRPFSADRKGMVLGEGAGVLVLEDMEHARARGAEILAEISGFGMSADADDIVKPNAKGAVQAMRAALEGAGAEFGKGCYINAHGTGTKANDVTECRAIEQVFGAKAAGVAISSTKSLHGHLIGAAGAVEVIACLMALLDGVIAPTANLGVRDPDCDLDIVAGEARHQPVQACLSNAFAFGGLNAVLALRRV